MVRRSIAVILSTGGATLNLDSLSEVPVGTVVRAELATGERAACVAATLEHHCERRELLAQLKRWAAGRGWSVTVASLNAPR